MHLKASRTPSKIDDMSQIQLELMMILMFLTGLLSLIIFYMVCTCPEGAMFKIWLKSNEFEGIKNPLKDQGHY
jgi:hypothetical protein